MEVRKKAIVFFQYLPPWRIDVFNEMDKYYDLTLIFFNSEVSGFTYNRELLVRKLRSDSIFLYNGFNIGTTAFRFGICKIIRKLNPEVIFSHEYSPISVLCATFLNIRLFNFRLIITTSDNVKMINNVSLLKKLLRRFVLNSSSGLIVYSNNVKEVYQCKFPDLRIGICPNIQNPSSLLNHNVKFPSIIKKYLKVYRLNKPVILYIGRLEYVKGLDLLIKAFSNTLVDTHILVLVGEGSEKNSLINLCKDLNIENNVIFPGYFDSFNLYAWYALSDFFVLPSRFEPFGAVVNEALVYGCPVLASINIGALDYIDVCKNGYVFDPDNKEEFEEVLKKGAFTFRGASIHRKNLMKSSFENSVKVFNSILD
jgi:glycosyltransferase involved in cell wall biosynthesis